MDGLPPIVHERRLRCDPADAFDTWLQMGQWWPADYSANPGTLQDVIVGREVGAPLLMRHRDVGDVEWGRITAWEPGVRLEHTCTLAMSGAEPSRLSVSFEPDGDGTVVRLEHGGWHAGNAAVRSKFGDWPLILDRYAAAPERHA